MDAQMRIKLKCPVCEEETLELLQTTYEVPYFGRVALINFSCSSCGFHRADLEILEEKKPSRHILKVQSPSDLYAKVIRSSSGKISIPEFGVEILPGIAAEPFITNVEGVLLRIEKIVNIAKRWREEEGNIEAVEKAKEILEKINRAKEGKEEFTLIIEDPTGNSAIISQKVVIEEI